MSTWVAVKTTQPRPQGLLLVKNGGRKNPWPRLPKWLQKFVRISSRKLDEMSSFCLNNGFRLQKAHRAARCWKRPPKKPFLHVSHDKIFHEFTEYFSSLGQGFLQPRPQGLLLVQNGARRNPWLRLLKYSKNRGVFCHVTRYETAFSEVGFRVWWPCLFFCNLKSLFKRNEGISKCLRDKMLTNFWSHFGSLGQGFLRPPFWTRRRPWGRGWGFSDRHFERGEGPGTRLKTTEKEE